MVPIEANTLGELLRKAAATFGEAEAVVGGGIRLTYVQLEEQSRELARRLLGRGVAKGSHVGVSFGNNPGFIVSFLFLVLTTIFVATTGDSMTYCVSVSMSQSDSPSTVVRVFWGMAMGIMALILISVGSGGVGKLQSFIVITAVPVSLVLLPSLWDAVRITHLKGKEQATAG